MLRRKSLCGNQIQIVISDATREDQSDRVYDVGTEIYKEVSKKKFQQCVFISSSTIPVTYHFLRLSSSMIGTGNQLLWNSVNVTMLRLF